VVVAHLGKHWREVGIVVQARQLHHLACGQRIGVGAQCLSRDAGALEHHQPQ